MENKVEIEIDIEVLEKIVEQLLMIGLETVKNRNSEFNNKEETEPFPVTEEEEEYFKAQESKDQDANLKQIYANPTRNEPVAWTDELWTIFTPQDYKKLEPRLQRGMFPLYKYPVKEFTDEEILKLFEKFWVDGSFDDGYEEVITIARAIIKEVTE